MLQRQQQQLQDCSAQQCLHAGQCADGSSSCWSADEHALFVWLRTQAAGTSPGQQQQAVRVSSSRSSIAHAHRTNSSTGSRSSIRSQGLFKAAPCSTKSAVLDYVGLRMPGKTRQQLEAHEAW